METVQPTELLQLFATERLNVAYKKLTFILPTTLEGSCRFFTSKPVEKAELYIGGNLVNVLYNTNKLDFLGPDYGLFPSFTTKDDLLTIVLLVESEDENEPEIMLHYVSTNNELFFPIVPFIKSIDNKCANMIYGSFLQKVNE